MSNKINVTSNQSRTEAENTTGAGRRSDGKTNQKSEAHYAKLLGKVVGRDGDHQDVFSKSRKKR